MKEMVLRMEVMRSLEKAAAEEAVRREGGDHEAAEAAASTLQVIKMFPESRRIFPQSRQMFHESRRMFSESRRVC
jgi:aromatic ring hydroxylase